MADEMYQPLDAQHVASITLQYLDRVLPDHDRLIVLETQVTGLLNVDHPALMNRMRSQETFQNRMIGLGGLAVLLAGAFGALIERLVK